MFMQLYLGFPFILVCITSSNKRYSFSEFLLDKSKLQACIFKFRPVVLARPTADYWIHRESQIKHRLFPIHIYSGVAQSRAAGPPHGGEPVEVASGHLVCMAPRPLTGEALQSSPPRRRPRGRPRATLLRFFLSGGLGSLGTPLD